MAVDLVVRNGKIVTPSGIADGGIAVSAGRIVAIASEAALPEGGRVIDAGGKYILPGLVDPEAHTGGHTPLAQHFSTETCAALASGVTTWGFIMPSAVIRESRGMPTADDVRPFSEVMPLFKKLGDANCRVDYYLTASLTRDEQAAEIPLLAEEWGVTSYKYYLHTKQGDRVHSQWFGQKGLGYIGFDDGTVYLGMENVAKIGSPGVVCIHPENWEIVRIFEDRLMKAGRMDMAAWDERCPHFCEAGHVWTYGYYAKVTGCPLYIQHVTTQETLDVIQKLRAEGVTVYAQTAACYLSLDHNTWKLNVPLRDRATMDKLWVAVRDGIVDCSGTDHVNPHAPREEMEVPGDVWATRSGFASRVEAYLPVMLSEGVNKGRISLQRLVKLCCENPAKIFGLYPKKGTIQVGADADLVIVDLDLEREVKRESIQSSSGWSIYEGWKMKGWPTTVILRGNVVMEWPAEAPKARMVGEPIGRYLARKPGQQSYPLG